MSANQQWWDIYGPFDPDPEDNSFPNAGQVVRHYRLLKKWTPTQLGEALDKTARWVQAMEHDNTVPEAISRRRALASMLGIPPILLGLASFENITGLQPKSVETFTKKTTINPESLNQYQQSLRLYWELYYSSTAYDMIEEIINSTRLLRSLASETSGYQHNQLIHLLGRYHQLVAHVLRDQQDYSTAFTYANRAVKIAQNTEDNELIASALLRRGLINFDQGNYTNALVDLDEAVRLAKNVRAPLKGFIFQIAGHTHAHIEGSNIDSMQAMSLLDQAGNIVHRGNLEDDQSFVKFGLGWYHQERAGAFLTMKRPSDALDELDRAEKLLGPDQPRRLAQINIFRSQAYFDKSDFSIATSIAEEALEVSKAVKSEHSITQIEDIYKQLATSKYGNSPQVGRLKHLLSSH